MGLLFGGAGLDNKADVIEEPAAEPQGIESVPSQLDNQPMPAAAAQDDEQDVQHYSSYEQGSNGVAASGNGVPTFGGRRVQGSSMEGVVNSLNRKRGGS